MTKVKELSYNSIGLGRKKMDRGNNYCVKEERAKNSTEAGILSLPIVKKADGLGCQILTALISITPMEDLYA